MKLCHKNIESVLEFGDNIPVLIIENPDYYTKLVSELIAQTNGYDGGFIIFENGVQLTFGIVDLILSPFEISTNSKTMLTRLYKKLIEKINNEDFMQDMLDIQSKVANFISNIVDDFETPIDFSPDIDFNYLFKSADIKFEENSNVDLCEKLVDYMKIVREFDKDKLFIFIGLKNYISKEKLEEFYKTIIANEYQIILFENISREKINCEKAVVIDDDLCEISY